MRRSGREKDEEDGGRRREQEKGGGGGKWRIEEGGGGGRKCIRIPLSSLPSFKMPSCSICKLEFSRGDKLNQHMKNKHNGLETIDQMTSSKTMTFKHPFSTVVSGPIGSGKSVWTKKLLLSSLIQLSPQRIIWCFV